MRLFAALEPPAEARALLAAWGTAAAARDRALRAVPAASLHMTLHFLGERPEGEAGALRDALAGMPDTPVALEGTGTLWLSPRRPHVLTCGLMSPGTALSTLHVALRGALEAAAPGWRADTRPLRPHVTVARVRARMRPATDRPPPAPALAFEASAVILERSVLDPAGARYETLARFPLRSAA